MDLQQNPRRTSTSLRPAASPTTAQSGPVWGILIWAVDDEYAVYLGMECDDFISIVVSLGLLGFRRAVISADGLGDALVLVLLQLATQLNLILGGAQGPMTARSSTSVRDRDYVAPYLPPSSRITRSTM